MEREVSIEEKIRRAEAIYNRRNGITIDNEIKKRKRPFRRLMKQIFWCFIIYMIFYTINNSNYIFSEEFLNNTREIFMKNTTINEIYNNIKNSFTGKQSTESEENVENNTENTEENNINNIENTAEENLTQNNENIGGAEENIAEENKECEVQIDEDVAYIKNNISFINPISGRISSTFGWRTPTKASVPKYHTGLDIAAVTGTKIKSATDGTVVLASSEGDYGKHLEIEIGELLIIYAHCNNIYLSNGDTVKQGQEIAEVGSTGNSTGPHLHFEIRRNGKHIDPQLIIDI